MAMINNEPGWWSQRLQAARDGRFWVVQTRLKVRNAQTYRGRELQAKLRDFAYWCEQSVARPDLIDADVFAEFIDHFSRIAGNYGAVEGVDVEGALNKVINMQEGQGRPTTRLWLAKARYRSMFSLEDTQRKVALDAALSGANVGTELWAEALLAYCWYLIDVSQYGRALRLLSQLKQELPTELFADRYRCGFHTMSGVALFTSFRDLRGARQHLLKACAYEEFGRSDQQIIRWVATAFHYLGRIAEVDKRYHEALAFYVYGEDIQEQCPEELQALAFLHLRLSEPLITLAAFDQAEHHLRLAVQYFADSAEHSSGRLQAQLGLATLSAAKGSTDDAVEAVEKIRQDARQIGFWRGELLCLGFQLSLCVRTRRFQRLPATAVHILKTMRGGELGRNNAAQLLLKIPVLLRIALRRMAYRPDLEKVTPMSGGPCPCPLHGDTSVAMQVVTLSVRQATAA
jgi:tetratricopeptide (TPR) repeat protein